MTTPHSKQARIIHRLIPLVLLLLAHITPALAQEEGITYDWQEKRNRDGIVIYTSKVDGSPFNAVRGEMAVEGRVSSLVALVEDIEACPDWAAMCKEATLVQRESPTKSYVYVYNDIPFPVKDRDVYALTQWTIHPSGKVTMTSRAQPGGTPETKAVRLLDAKTQWHFTDLGDGTVRVENYAHIDPNGPTPAWIINILLIDSPFDSMTNMRELIEGGAYKDARVAFLPPPTDSGN